MSTDKQTLDGLRIDRAAAPKKNNQRGWLLPAAFALIAVVAALVWWLTPARAAQVRTISVQQSDSGGQRTLLNASGYVTARRQATVSSKVTGKVVEVLVEEGMRVEAGQVLARVDASNVEKSLRLSEAQLDSARKGLDETKASLDQAEKDLKRTSDLAASKIASESELEHADADAKALRARLERQKADVVVAERELDQWRQQLEDTTIRAPFSGIVTSKNAQPGEMISPMSAGGSFTRTGICTIVDMNSLEIEVDVSESYINRVEPGQKVQATLDSYPDWRIPSKVIAIIPAADRQKATVKVRVGFEKLDSKILPDMGVKVAFQSEAPAASPAGASMILIPRAALRQDGGRDIVWVVKDGRVERRAVTASAARGDNVPITAGLAGGERVVIEGPATLADGIKVTELQQPK